MSDPQDLPAGDPKVTPKLQSLIYKLSKSEPRQVVTSEMGGARAGGASAATSGDGTSVAKIKVNFVPAEEFRQIKGIGEKIAQRMHLMRLVVGNLTPENLKDQFGGKMTDSMLNHMDFQKSDLIVERFAEVGLPKVEPLKLENVFDTEIENDTKPSKMRKRREKVSVETESGTDSEDELEIESQTSNKSYKKKSGVKDKQLQHKKKSNKKSLPAECTDTSETETDDEIPLQRKHKKREKSVTSDSDDELKSRQNKKTNKADKTRDKSRSKKNRHKCKSKKKSLQVESTDTSESETDSDDKLPTKLKHKKSKRKIKSETSDTSDDDATSLQKVPRGFDKNLRFSGSSDGKGDDFDSFKLKFKSYSKAFKWTEEECRYCLCWSLQGAAAKYHTLVSSGAGPLSYKQLMKKLEKRFGGKELVETAQARFNQASQEPNESLEVWADRIQMLALRAFRKVSEKYAASQAVNRFCLGLENKEASKDASLKRIKTMDEAKDFVHYYLHINNTTSKAKSSRRTSSREPEEAINVYESSINRIQTQIDDRLKQMQSQFDKQMALNRRESAGARNGGYGRGTSGFNQMGSSQNREGYGRGGGYTQWYDNRSQGGYGRGGGFRGRSSLGRQSRGRGDRNIGWEGQQETGGREQGINDCFFCGETGHIRADCKKWLATQECFACHEFGHRKVACPKRQAQGAGSEPQQGLNRRGSGKGAAPDS